MEVHREVIFHSENRKVIMFSILPSRGKESLALRKLDYAILNYYLETGVMYNRFKDVQNPYLQLLVEGLPT